MLGALLLAGAMGVSVTPAPALAPLPMWKAPSGEAVQCLAAVDGQAYLFLSTGRAFEILGRHQLHEIPTPGGLAEWLHAIPFRAAVAPDGRWLFTGGYGAVLVVDGEEISEISAPGMAQEVAWWDGEPVAHFTHGNKEPYAEILEDEADPNEAVAIYAYDSRERKWAAHGIEDLSDSLRPEMAAIYKTDVLLAGEGKGGLWIANAYHWRLRRFSAGGKRLLDIDLPEISVSMDRASQEAAEEKLLQTLRAKGAMPEKITRITAAPGAPIVLALAGDKSMGYVLWRTPDLPAAEGFLNRVQAGQIERMRIRFSGKTQARLIRSMALDSSGLVLAPLKGSTGGLWRITVEALVGAEWELVEPGAEGEP